MNVFDGNEFGGFEEWYSGKFGGLDEWYGGNVGLWILGECKFSRFLVSIFLWGQD